MSWLGIAILLVGVVKMGVESAHPTLFDEQADEVSLQSTPNLHHCDGPASGQEPWLQAAATAQLEAEELQ